MHPSTAHVLYTAEPVELTLSASTQLCLASIETYPAPLPQSLHTNFPIPLTVQVAGLITSFNSSSWLFGSIAPSTLVPSLISPQCSQISAVYPFSTQVPGTSVAI